MFIELAQSRRLSRIHAEQKYGLDRGKANAYIEFDVNENELFLQPNRRQQIDEYYLVGDIDLAERHAESFYNL